MQQTRRHLALLALPSLLFLAACGSNGTQPAGTTPKTANATSAAPATADVVPPGDIPDTQAFVPYRSRTGGYTVQYPEGWSKREQGKTTTFTSQFNVMTVFEAPAAAKPTVATVRSVDAPELARSLQGFKLVGVDEVDRPAGRAIRLSYQAISGTDPVTGKTLLLDTERYTFYAPGRLVTITLASPHGSDNVDPWAKITRSFRWT